MSRVTPQFDHRLIGVWGNDRLAAEASPTFVRILFMKNFSGRYETWHHGLNEVITFNWSPPAVDRVTLAGVDYLFREASEIRREPCDWHFEAVPYSIAAENEMPVLQLQFGPKRIDRFGLVTTDMSGHDEPKFA
jgi:hypothetical protein